MCVVDAGGRALQAACVLPATRRHDGQRPTPPPMREARKMQLWSWCSPTTIKSASPACAARTASCRSCAASSGVENGDRIRGQPEHATPSMTLPLPSCGITTSASCAAAAWPPAHKVQHVGVIGAVNRGFTTAIECPWNDAAGAKRPASTAASASPPAPWARCTEKDSTDKVWDAAGRSGSSMWLCSPPPPCAPPWARNSACPSAPASPARWLAALRRLGFDKVFDTDFAADLTIMEEGTELIEPGEEGRRAAHDYLLLARLDQVLRAPTIPNSFPICPPANLPTR